MKKYIALSILILFSACRESTTVTNVNPKGGTIEGINHTRHMEEIQYKGHTYLLIDGYHEVMITHAGHCNAKHN